MKEVAIVFTHDDNGYYIEEVFESLEKAQEEWELDKIFEGMEWQEFQEEMNDPSTAINCQVAVIHKVS
ncbi:hypothetical protein [Cytobacillus kochii]|uniref:Uncharacterized protein n=1 Tax=Cytobacillus kochii TaxID=859143 RepID=A0A248THC5_9BACI|nr:hypothetical protein [Cytobacillus kochii]ASV67593.1 hypothetical protein CKF48_09825 [Cytobacillus kochii]MDQ0186345.1 hypothetical protein [Cytobacillus kochii]